MGRSRYSRYQSKMITTHKPYNINRYPVTLWIPRKITFALFYVLFWIDCFPLFLFWFFCVRVCVSIFMWCIFFSDCIFMWQLRLNPFLVWLFLFCFLNVPWRCPRHVTSLNTWQIGLSRLYEPQCKRVFTNTPPPPLRIPQPINTRCMWIPWPFPMCSLLKLMSMTTNLQSECQHAAISNFYKMNKQPLPNYHPTVLNVQHVLYLVPSHLKLNKY